MIGKCEFCGNEKELGESTPFHGFYCMDCMRMNIQYDKESIAEMKHKSAEMKHKSAEMKHKSAEMKHKRRQRIDEKELERLEKEKDAALKALMNF